LEDDLPTTKFLVQILKILCH